jgi:RNase P subunit RPR2
MKKDSKTGSKLKIESFFVNIKNKTPKEIKKIKKLAMSNNISLKEKRKLFCKKCLAPYSGKEKVRINNKVKKIACDKCNSISRWKLK